MATRRVLHLRTVTGAGGGPEKTILNSPRYIGAGYEMRLGYFRPSDDPDYDLPQRARSLGVELVDIPEAGPIDCRALRRLAKEIREFRPHLLHAHDYKTNLLAVLFGRWFGVPVVTTLHGYVTRSKKLHAYYAVDRWSLRRMRHVIAVSDDLYSKVLEFGIAPERCSMVHNAIDSDVFQRHESRPEAKRKLGFGADRLLVGAVGRLSVEKGFDILIRAVDRLIGEGCPVELAIAGDGPERSNLLAAIAKCKEPKRLRLLGHCKDVMGLYAALDVYVLCSLREGLPNAMLEAMSMEVPVIATRIAAIPRVIADGNSGLLVPPADEDALVESLRRLLNDAALRERLGGAGRQCMVERFSFHRRMEKIRAIYDQVLA